MDVTRLDKMKANVKLNLPGSASAIIYDPPTTGPTQWGAMPLTTMLLNAKGVTSGETRYALSRIPREQSSGIYLIRYKPPGQHSAYFKVGRGKRLLRRLAGYKTYMPADNSILLVACLSVSDIMQGLPSTGRAPALVCGLEDALLRNMDAWAEKMPTKIKRVRRTEWFLRNDTAEALVVAALWQFTSRIAQLHPTLKATLHIYSKSVWNTSISIVDMVDYKSKSKKKKLSSVEAAEEEFIDHQRLDGFTKAEMKQALPAAWRK